MNSFLKIVQNKVFFKEKELKGISSHQLSVISAYIVEDESGIWWIREFSKGVVKSKFLTKDKNNFAIIDDTYGKDGKSVYLIDKMGVKIPNSDATTFEVLRDTPYFSKDKNQLYAYSSTGGLSIYNQADMSTIVPLGWSAFISDKHNLYHFGEIIELVNVQKHINLLDSQLSHEGNNSMSKFEANKKAILNRYPQIIGWWHPIYPYQIDTKNIKGNYCKDKTCQVIYYLEKKAENTFHTIISKAKLQTFEPINDFYSKDHAHVFFKNRLVDFADQKSFEIVDKLLAKDNHNYYYNGYRIDCDFESFEFVSHIDSYRIIAKDKNRVFYSDLQLFGKIGLRTGKDWVLNPIKNSKPETFINYSKAWSKDSGQVYHYDKIFKKADVESFTYLNGGFAKDKNHLFATNNLRIVKGVDGMNFNVLNNYWGKDQKVVVSLVSGKLIKSADSKSFKLIDDNGNAEDKNHYYYFDYYKELKRKKK